MIIDILMSNKDSDVDRHIDVLRKEATLLHILISTTDGIDDFFLFSCRCLFISFIATRALMPTSKDNGRVIVR